MEAVHTVLQWFAGGTSHPYHTLWQCLHGDALWVWITILLDLAVTAGYGLIAYHWWANQRTLPPSPAKKALGNMRNIFLFCGICGYLFIPIKMVWPAWRLYDIFLAVLVYFTWKYAWGAKDLRVVYSELGRSRLLQADLDRSKEEARRKNAFFNAVSHDLRTPLNGIMLQAELVEMATQSNDAELLKQASVQIKATARQAADMLEALLDIARIDAGAEKAAHTSFNLREMVDESLANIAATATAKGLLLRNDVPAKMEVRSDRAKLMRILANLLSNAVKFTERGSVVVSADLGSRGFELHVTDTGVGVSKEDQERLFDEFYQVHNPARDRSMGFGLGLTIARRLARLMNGEITVQSDLGSGSRFTIAVSDLSQADNGVPDRGDTDAQRDQPFSSERPVREHSTTAAG